MKSLVLCLALIACGEAMAALPLPFHVSACNGCAGPSMCPVGGKAICRSTPDPECSGGSLFYWDCELPPPKAPHTVKLYPNFHITHVVYAPAGRSSAMQYVAGDVVGSSTSITANWDDEARVEFNVKGGFLFASGTFNLQTAQAWGSSRSDIADVSLTTIAGYRKNGQVDVVDHDDDEVWFLAQAAIVVETTAAGFFGPKDIHWWFDASAPAVPYYLTVGELKGTRPIPPGVQQALSAWGITPADFPELLKANPFLGNADPTQDTSRFDFLGAYPYIPPPAPGLQANPQTYAVTRRVANTSARTDDIQYTAQVRVGGGFQLGENEATISFQNRFQFKNSTSERNSTEANTTNTLTVGQPAHGYHGPTVLRVYLDKIWKTYAFRLDWY